MGLQVGKTKLRFIQDDITEQETDAIVNPANPSLLGGGGVDCAIHRKGGPKILEQCKKIRDTLWREGLHTGKAVITSGGELKTRNVIHVVGPVWRGGGKREQELLAEAYRNSLVLAVSEDLKPFKNSNGLELRIESLLKEFQEISPLRENITLGSREYDELKTFADNWVNACLLIQFLPNSLLKKLVYLDENASRMQSIMRIIFESNQSI